MTSRHDNEHLTYNWRIFDSSDFWPYNFSSGSNGIGPSTAPLSSSFSPSLEIMKNKLMEKTNYWWFVLFFK